VKRAYKSINMRQAALNTISTANSIIEEYQGQGLRLTLRQLYYQFVARGLIPNQTKEYKKLAATISDGRLAGYVDWDAIEDRGRQPDVPAEWDSVQDLIDAAIRSFRLPRWDGQDNYVELWVEKQALAGVLEPLASEFHVTLMVNKGYSSQSAMWESANRFKRASQHSGVLLYLGDHDPSGEDMVRDIRDRMHMFGADLVVRKLALTWDQIQQHHPPPNPVKFSDSRSAGYQAEHGDECWEVDALDPATLAQLIRDEFEELLDRGMMDEVIEKEDVGKAALKRAAKRIDKEMNQ
jgi:hypothetical protein